MALLIVEHDGRAQAGVISGRVVIGRRPEHQLRAADKAVSPIHAWIDVAEDGTYFIADAGSKTGTLVNDQPVTARHPLQYGDRIRIGSLSVRFAEGKSVPAGARLLDLRPREAPAPTPAAGIAFDCACGAPLWAPWNAAGKTGRCRTCGNSISIPQPKKLPPASRTGAQTSPCGVCHSAIQPLEETTSCPSCGTVFHIECWTENGGCSVYGCAEASVAQGTEAADSDDNATASACDDPQHLAIAHGGMPLAYALLAASVLGAVAGTLTFGGTSLLAAAAGLLYLFRANPQRQRRVVYLSIAVSLIGAAAGVVVSYYWWMGAKTWRLMR